MLPPAATVPLPTPRSLDDEKPKSDLVVPPESLKYIEQLLLIVTSDTSTKEPLIFVGTPPEVQYVCPQAVLDTVESLVAVVAVAALPLIVVISVSLI